MPKVAFRKTTVDQRLLEAVSELTKPAYSPAEEQSPRAQFSDQFFQSLSRSARVGKRTTRTTLAVGGFSFLGVILVALFGLSGEGVRDLRSQVVASVITLVAAIAGFFFGGQNAGGGTGTTPPAVTPPPVTAPPVTTPPVTSADETDETDEPDETDGTDGTDDARDASRLDRAT